MLPPMAVNVFMVYLGPWNMQEAGTVFPLLPHNARGEKTGNRNLYLKDWNGRVANRPCLHSDWWILSSQSFLSVDGRLVYWLEQKTSLGYIPHGCAICWQLCHSVAVCLSETLDSQEPLLPEGPLKSQELKTATLSTVTSNLGHIRKGRGHVSTPGECLPMFCFG